MSHMWAIASNATTGYGLVWTIMGELTDEANLVDFYTNMQTYIIEQDNTCSGMSGPVPKKGNKIVD